MTERMWAAKREDEDEAAPLIFRGIAPVWPIFWFGLVFFLRQHNNLTTLKEVARVHGFPQTTSQFLAAISQ